ncbi:MAG: gfo/Idh/MocA family oxidoreductase, partial [Akkermansiaceae bacterium]|nr:gfo/Idh/MocA family oxidoreductase [Akkermansiaceae bacterium]
PPGVRLGLDRDRGEFRKGFQDVGLPEAGGRYDGEFLDLARVIRGEKKLAWDARHDLAVHEAVLRASGMLTAE